MLPPGTLQMLIRRYRAARQKMEDLAVELAAALSLPGQAAPMAEAPVKRRAPYAPRVTNGAGKARAAAGESWRVDQIVAAIRKNGPSTARDMVRLIPDLSMGSAYTVMSAAVKSRVLVRTEKGVYTVADSHAALPAILRQAVRGKEKKTPTSSARPVRLAQGGGIAIQQKILDLADKLGGVVTLEDILAAGLVPKRKIAQQHLVRATAHKRLIRIAPGKYALPGRAEPKGPRPSAGGTSKAKAALALAAKLGGIITTEDATKAGIGYKLKNGTLAPAQLLAGLAERGHLVHVSKGRYALPKKNPAKGAARSDGPLFDDLED